jgi:DNA-binding protein YbaB
MNIGSIGRSFVHDAVGDILFDSTRTVLDFDAVFIDAASLAQGGQSQHSIRFRRNEFSEFLALGRTIVVFTDNTQLEVFLPIQPPRLKTISGNKVDFKGPDHLKTFWQSVQADMQFLAHFETPPGQPFLYVSSTNKSIATWVKHESGNLLLLPWLKPFDGNQATYRQRCANFVAAFQKLNELLVLKKPALSLPAWSEHYGWDRERELKGKVTSLQKQLDEISKQISTKTRELEIEDKLKVLFTCKGDALVRVVIDVFQELGAKANPGEPGRDDVIIEFEGKHAVIEVKGKKSSAAESDAAQLEKWVAGFKEEKAADPKGILLIDAHCETPLAERIEPAFPHQMLKYSTQREHCLITTTQLLGILLEARVRPEKRVELVNSLFSTVGVYQEFSDWRKFLTAPAPDLAKAK